ncbi:MAG: NADH:ubiquinone reductase (Na(+)-transporting) subunit A, partial [Candidatus Aminicenantes bacterium]|nr:NADH:ubiquinone reductase (Na(+)-transporting) subunit A [Candidatus Aminicenantes bacterium]
TSIRARPYSKVADPGILPHSLFITAMDTNPHAPLVDAIIERNERDFVNGTIVLSKLTDGKTFICKCPGAPIPAADIKSLEVKEFAGPHPSGNVGTHIHFLDPVCRNKTVWHINSQDVIAIGRFFISGKIPIERVISLAGPSVKQPRLLKIHIGACIEDITESELLPIENRFVSGSVLSGRISTGAVTYIGRYHQQISVLEERRDRKFLGWMSPGFNIFSSRNIVISRLFPKKKFNFTTAIHGGERAIMPIGNYEKVMPLDILATFLLRSLMVDDIEEAEKLGCLELDEEDLALCSFVSPSKIDYGQVLRRNLTIIEKEG